VFDMEVVRDTKDVSFRFPFAAAAALLGGLAIGGFMVGAGLTLFQGEGAGGGGDAGPAPVQDTSIVVATDNRFNPTTLTAPPNTEVTFTLQQRGNSPHNLHFLTARGGQTLAPGAEGAILTARGQTDDVTFTTPGPGEYFFLCDIHPDEMTGTLRVVEGAPVPGAPNGGTTGS
jgi:plastocyanin